MQDHRDIEQDYVRRLREAQEKGDKQHVPWIDESRIKHGQIIPVSQAEREAFESLRKFFTSKEGLGATEKV